MSRLPVVSGKQVVKALMNLGYYVRDRESSHIHLRHPTRQPLTVPDHREVAKGTLRAIIRDAGLTKDQFVDLLA